MKKLYFALSVLFAATTLGCGLGGQQFHGTYNVTGTITLTFTGYGSETDPLSISYRISEGATSDIVISETTGGQCSFPADVEGAVAIIRPGTSCTQVLNGVTVTRTVTNGAASLSGQSVQLNLSGNLSATANGKTYPGTFIQNATLTRVGK